MEPVGSNCRLTIPYAYTFEGDVTGTATGTVYVLIFASCIEVEQNPPGTFADRFEARLDFEGGIFGASSSGVILYHGRTAPGGAVTGKMIVNGTHHGVLTVQGQLGADGTYDGRLTV